MLGMMRLQTDEGLVVQETIATDDMPAEFPGIQLETDMEDSDAITNAPQPPDWAISDRALQMLILHPPLEMTRLQE